MEPGCLKAKELSCAFISASRTAGMANRCRTRLWNCCARSGRLRFFERLSYRQNHAALAGFADGDRKNAERIEKMLPELAQMIGGGLVTLEKFA
jgi:hypothetical protein